MTPRINPLGWAVLGGIGIWFWSHWGHAKTAAAATMTPKRITMVAGHIYRFNGYFATRPTSAQLSNFQHVITSTTGTATFLALSYEGATWTARCQDTATIDLPVTLLLDFRVMSIDEM